jgi:hypothetical protein
VTPRLFAAEEIVASGLVVAFVLISHRLDVLIGLKSWETAQKTTSIHVL